MSRYYTWIEEELLNIAIDVTTVERRTLYNFLIEFQRIGAPIHIPSNNNFKYIVQNSYGAWVCVSQNYFEFTKTSIDQFDSIYLTEFHIKYIKGLI